MNGLDFEFHDANTKPIKQTHVCGKFAVNVKLRAILRGYPYLKRHYASFIRAFRSADRYAVM